jgi:Flp pilus assembly pilin Flp
VGDRREIGNVSVEYAVLLALVSVGVALGLIALGRPLLQMAVLQRAWVALPFP